MAYRLSKEEMETHITWDAQNKEAHIYTCDPVYMRKLDKLCQTNPESYVLKKEETLNGAVISKYYYAPSKLISFRTPTNRVMSEEQKEAAAERMRNIAKKRKEESQN